MNLNSTLSQPPKMEVIPDSSQWLSGEGAGSWFYIESAFPFFNITRYSPEGNVECNGLFSIINQSTFNINLPYRFTYLSHCQLVTITQNDTEIKMSRI